MSYKKHVETEMVSIGCKSKSGHFSHGWGYEKNSTHISEERKAEIKSYIGTVCEDCGYTIEDQSYTHKHSYWVHTCRKCNMSEEDEGSTVQERFSLGITAGYFCDEHWESSGYRKDGPEGYDFYDAGEYYSEEDY